MNMCPSIQVRHMYINDSCVCLLRYITETMEFQGNNVSFLGEVASRDVFCGEEVELRSPSRPDIMN